MSLLEDVFLEDEAGEAQDLERVIEGDEFEERRQSVDDDEDGNSVRGEDEAEEDKRRVDPQAPKSVRVVKNPRFVLNPARLTGPRGIHVIPEHFKDFKFKGKGHEKEDLDLVLKKLEHWTYRLYPKFKFADCLKKIEALGKKRPVMVHLHKIRSDQFQSEETVVQQDSSDDETAGATRNHQEPPEEDEFDKLLQQQIDISRTMTPAPGSGQKGFRTPGGDVSTPFTMPKATSSPSISDEQKERMIRNRRLAEERRLARLKQNSGENLDASNANNSVDLTGVSEIGHKESNNKENQGDFSEHVDLTESGHNGVSSNKKITNYGNDIVVRDTVDLTEVNENKDVNETPISKNLNDVSPNKKVTNNGNDTVDLSENNKNTDGSKTPISKNRPENVSDTIDLSRNLDCDMDDDEINTSGPKTMPRVNVIDSSDEDCDMTAVNTTITVHIHKDNVNNVNRTNRIDSSDDEQDLRIVNESVSVGNHKPVNDDNVKLDDESDDPLDKDTNLKDDEEDNVIEVQSVPTKEINNDVSEVPNQDNNLKEKVDSTGAVDSDIMDVDFGDDF